MTMSYGTLMGHNSWLLSLVYFCINLDWSLISQQSVHATNQLFISENMWVLHIPGSNDTTMVFLLL